MQIWLKIDLWKRVMMGLFLGLGVGLALYYSGKTEIATVWIAPWGQAFINLIKMLIVPLVFTTLTAGVIAMGDPKRLGSLGGRALSLYVATTAIAVTIGLTIGTLIQPGKGLSADTFAVATPEDMANVTGKLTRADEAGSLAERLLNIIPQNIVSTLSDNGAILPVIFFSILFGIGILMAGDGGKRIGEVVESAAEVMLKITVLVMEFAPFGVFALMATVMATQGPEVLQNLGLLAAALYLACFLHIIFTYGGIIKVVLRLPAMPFFRGVVDAQSVAYSTASSSATLPVTIACAKENLGISPPVASSVLPLGATINMDGTAIYIGLVALFGAQALGMDLSLTQYLLVAVMATAVSIGAAGIPSAGLLLASAALMQVGIQEETAILIIAFIFPFDRLLDMMRTLTNVTGDAAVATAVANWEGEFDRDIYMAKDI